MIQDFAFPAARLSGEAFALFSCKKLGNERPQVPTVTDSILRRDIFFIVWIVRWGFVAIESFVPIERYCLFEHPKDEVIKEKSQDCSKRRQSCECSAAG